jgi:sphingolipid delta-4 desaturase
MGSRTSKTEFTWSDTDEPHASRRTAILKQHPEISRLFVKEPLTFWIVLGIFLAQCSLAYILRAQSWPVILVCAYFLGGTMNHSLQLAAHELSHWLCWETPVANTLTALFANLVTGFPSAITFRRYHLEHHVQQGSDGVDTDIPTRLEILLFDSPLKKVIWLLLQPAFYAVRPLLVKPKPPTVWELVNWITCLSFNVSIAYFFSGRALAYLIIGTLLGMGLHPCAGHFIAEHYEMVKGQETYSYYGFCNYLNFNVGYHNEHHDFPSIPWSRLPEVRKIAPEFYKDFAYHTSYVKVMWRYITDSSIGPASRIKRASKAKSEQF